MMTKSRSNFGNLHDETLHARLLNSSGLFLDSSWVTGNSEVIHMSAQTWSLSSKRQKGWLHHLAIGQERGPEGRRKTALWVFGTPLTSWMLPHI